MNQLLEKSKPTNLGGRPRKFSESSRPVTVTLPDRVLSLLQSVHEDRALAIAKATDWVTRSRENSAPAVELVEVEKGRAVIIVGPSRALQQLSWLRLVEIAPTRFLLVIPTGTPIETLEVSLMDLYDSTPKEDEYERRILGELKRCLTAQRRGKKVSKAELLLVDVS